MISSITQFLTRKKNTPCRQKSRSEIEEEQFILAINSLKTLHVTPSGTMRIDVSEIRDQVLASRERYKDLIKKAGH